MADTSIVGFTGAFQDPVTAAYPLGNGYRWFLPALMRFNAPDGFSPFGAGGINSYAYCEGDPVNYSDPGGHVAELWSGIIEANMREAYERGVKLSLPENEIGKPSGEQTSVNQRDERGTPMVLEQSAVSSSNGEGNKPPVFPNLNVPLHASPPRRFGYLLEQGETGMNVGTGMPGTAKKKYTLKELIEGAKAEEPGSPSELLELVAKKLEAIGTKASKLEDHKQSYFFREFGFNHENTYYGVVHTAIYSRGKDPEYYRNIFYWIDRPMPTP